MTVLQFLGVLGACISTIIMFVEVIKEALYLRKQKKYSRAYRRYNYFMAIGLIESADIIKKQTGIMLEWK